MKDHFLQGSLAKAIVEGRAGLAQKQGQLFPVPEHVGDRLAKTGVGLDEPILELPGKPRVKRIHDRAALGLMELQAGLR